jgi:hypothetical protein
MLLGHGNKWDGQYFTPQVVADCMAAMCMHDIDIEAEFRRRAAQACDRDPLLKALGITTSIFPGHDSPLSQKFATLLLNSIEPFKIYDPCVGSGVMLLSAAKHTPRHMIDIGFVQFYGQDIDHTCVDMCRLNMRIYGMLSGSFKVYDDPLDLDNVPPQMRESYETVRIARENGDRETEQQGLNQVASYRQSFLFGE